MHNDLARKESPSQTAGPYVHIGCTPNFVGISGVYSADLGSKMISTDTIGERIKINGYVFDGEGEPIRDAMVEIWQADSAGFYKGQNSTDQKSDPEFTGWGRRPVNLETGQFIFDTIKPGHVPYADGRLQAPHINVWIVARGINLGLSTRIYFADEEAANANDPVLGMLEEDRAATLIAEMKGGQYCIEVQLQGENETVFFDV